MAGSFYQIVTSLHYTQFVLLWNPFQSELRWGFAGEYFALAQIPGGPIQLLEYLRHVSTIVVSPAQGPKFPGKRSIPHSPIFP